MTTYMKKDQRPLFAWQGWLTLIVSLVLYIASAILMIRTERSIILGVGFNFTGVAFVALGLLIRRFRPDHRFGWLCLGVGWIFHITFPLLPLLDYFATLTPPPTLSPYLAWLANFLNPVMLLLLFFFVPMLFPDGNYPSASWRWLTGFVIATNVLLTLIFAVLPGTVRSLAVTYPFENPFALNLPVSQDIDRVLIPISGILLIVPVLVANGSLFFRWRSASGTHRQQLKWFATFVATVVAFFMALELLGAFRPPSLTEIADQQFFTLLYDIVVTVGWLGYPTVVAIAIFRYRLYDIDLIIRRTLQYGVLTAILAGVYFGGVTLLQSLFASITGSDSTLAVVINTLVIAALFRPLQTRLQRFIDRRFFRQKYDATRVLSDFADAVRDEIDVEDVEAALLRAVGETVQPESVGLWLREGES